MSKLEILLFRYFGKRTLLDDKNNIYAIGTVAWSTDRTQEQALSILNPTSLYFKARKVFNGTLFTHIDVAI